MGERVERTLSYYSKQDETLVGEYPLDGLNLGILQAMFGVAEDDPMYEVFPVGPEQAEALRPYFGDVFQPDRYDYFVECFAVPDEAEPATPRQAGR